MSPFISFSDSNCFGLSGATDEADEFSDPWLPPNDLRSDPRLIRSPGKLVFSPISSASASVRLDFLFKPGVSTPCKSKNHNIKRDHNIHLTESRASLKRKITKSCKTTQKGTVKVVCNVLPFGLMNAPTMFTAPYCREGFNNWDYKLNLWADIL